MSADGFKCCHFRTIAGGRAPAAVLSIGLAVLAGACSVVGGAPAEGGASEQTPKIVLSRDTPDLAPGQADIQPLDAVDDAPNRAPSDADSGYPAQQLPDSAAASLSALEFDLFDGGVRTLGHYRGTPLVVNFFASWCPPCVRELPEFQAVHSDLGSDVAFLGLSQDADASDALELVEAAGVTFDIGWDPDLEVYGETGSIAMPTTAFLTAEGVLADVFAGALTRDGLTERIAAVAGSAASPQRG